MAQSDYDKLIKDIEADLGTQVKELGKATWPVIERISSGSRSLDAALGGGWPRGRFAEIFGEPSGGKSLMTLLAIAEAQKAGGKAALIDVEHAFDPTHASHLGVDVNALYFNQPDYGEQALEVVGKLAQSNLFDMIVLDSVAELLPKSKLEGKIEDQTIALLARMMSNGLQKLSPIIGKSKAVVLFINQTRTNPMAMYGDPTTTPGGAAFKFYSSIRIKVGRVSKSERVDTASGYIIGHDINCSVVKNKTAPPFRTAVIPIDYATGVKRDKDFFNALCSRGLFAWEGGVRYKGTKVESIKEQRWRKWEDFEAWLVDPANAASIDILQTELTA